MQFFLSAIFFIFGTIIGSFLNVVILRLNTERNFGGRSACMSCGHKLSWYELVPILSFLFLRGRCLKCRNKISWQYPVVELLTGLIFLLLFLKLEYVFLFDLMSFILAYAFYAAEMSLLLVAAVYDLRHKIIPDRISLLFGALGFIGLFLLANGFPLVHTPTILEFSAGILLALPFYLVWLLSRGKWMGLGDAKLALGIGWLLGVSGGFSAAVVAFWAGAIIGIALVLFSKKHGMKSEVPFAPYLALGTVIAFIFDLHLF